ncbi:MAG: hypothetical protein ACM30E_12615 [Nitrososphaerales archaeon]
MLRWLILVVVLGIVLAGCSLIPGAGVGSGGALTYDGAAENGIAPGQMIPGTNIQFVRRTDEGAEVLIDGQRAVKKVGDSLDWKGAVGGAADVSMAQRIALITNDRLQTVGTVRVTIRGVNPVAGAAPGAGRYVYEVASGYTVRKGERVPGTTLVYVGKTDQGAQFSGTDDYPYRRVGDSISWQGQLAPGVYLDTTMRVVAYTDDIVTLAGLATIIVL